MGRSPDQLQIGIADLWRGGECRTIALPDHPAFFDNYMPIGQAHHRGQILVNQQDRLAFGAELRQDLPDFCADQRCQTLSRLIQHQQARIGHQGASDREHLLLPTRKLGARLAAPFG